MNKFIEVSPVSASSIEHALAPLAQVGWRVQSIQLWGAPGAKKPTYALILLYMPRAKVAGSIGDMVRANAGDKKKRTRKMIDLGELDWGDAPDISELELEVQAPQKVKAAATLKKTKSKKARK